MVDTKEALDAHLATPGDHCLFMPGDPRKNLDPNDAAVVLPELVAAFQGRFDVVLIGDAIDRETRQRFDVWPAPSIVFTRDGEMIGSITRIRNWEDYLRRISLILDGGAAAAAE